MKVFLDACVIIYWVELAEPYYKKFKKQLHRIRDKYGAVSFAASALSLLECKVKPLRENDKALLQSYQQFFHAADLEIISLSNEIIEHAAEIRASFNFRTPDALQAASALSIPNDKILFITNDPIFKKITQLEVLSID